MITLERQSSPCNTTASPVYPAPVQDTGQQISQDRMAERQVARKWTYQKPTNTSCEEAILGSDCRVYRPRFTTQAILERLRLY